VSGLAGLARGATREISTVVALLSAAIISVFALRITGPLAHKAIHAAWLANTARILSICVAAMTWGSDFALGVFHAWGGLAVLFVMFGLCWGLLQFQQTLPSKT
jgi:membrane protein required for colicin V production